MFARTISALALSAVYATAVTASPLPHHTTCAHTALHRRYGGIGGYGGFGGIGGYGGYGGFGFFPFVSSFTSDFDLNSNRANYNEDTLYANRVNANAASDNIHAFTNANIDCPHRDKCGRGSLCLYRHRSDPEKKEPVKKEMVKKQSASVVQEAKAHDSVPTAQATAAVQTAEPQTQVESKLVAAEPTPTAKAECEPSEVDNTTWRALTLNYDYMGPAYNSLCETTQVPPQLKAIVGDKIGYAKRQRALALIYEQMIKANSSPLWMPAKLAVECEDQIYRDSGPGTYHGKLAVCLKDMKKQ
ncbi:hypothetical protein GGI20_000464 [Coemansia sp. BCRC 34301]|nr:hypothetical protein GGI20_000464 [Coemansia sp. BCRC 34301]